MNLDAVTAPAPVILLATLNAKYIHSALGLRYLYANLGALQPLAQILEFTTAERPIDIAERLLAGRPRIIGLGVYVWNAQETEALVTILKCVSPQTVVVLGGPEVSYEWQRQPLVAAADFLITGQADLAFAQLCQRVLSGSATPDKVIAAGEVALDQLTLPYAWYTDQDIAQRLLYVEASRGCPFHCEFCLSSLDKTAAPFGLESFLQALDGLYRRGARQFKFVDRTFNLQAETARRILTFFLDRLDPKLFLHFELVPDRIPDALRSLLAQFPPGAIQLEIGVQTLQPAVQSRIRRRQDDRATANNLRWLRENTHAHLHVDLIAGLPGETMAEFGAGFDQLIALAPHEIQVGLLKRLRGAPIARHTADFDLRFDQAPPYQILSSSTWSFSDMQRVARLARYWDLIGNSGRFRCALALILGDQPFARLLAVADWLFATTAKTHQIALDRLFLLLQRAMCEALALDPVAVQLALVADYRASGLRGDPESLGAVTKAERARQGRQRAVRQDRHTVDQPGHGDAGPSASARQGNRVRLPGGL